MAQQYVDQTNEEMSLLNMGECYPKTLIMRAKRAHDVTTTMTSSNPTSVETGRIRKSSWNSAFRRYHSTHSVLCLLHSYSILLEKRYLTGVPYSPSMHSSPQVLRCFFQSEPPPLSATFSFLCFSEPRILREGTRDQLLCNC